MLTVQQIFNQLNGSGNLSLQQIMNTIFEAGYRPENMFTVGSRGCDHVSVAAALVAAAADPVAQGNTIILSNGVFGEDVVLPVGVNMVGYGPGSVIDGALTVSSIGQVVGVTIKAGHNYTVGNTVYAVAVDSLVQDLAVESPVERVLYVGGNCRYRTVQAGINAAVAAGAGIDNIYIVSCAPGVDRTYTAAEGVVVVFEEDFPKDHRRSAFPVNYANPMRDIVPNVTPYHSAVALRFDADVGLKWLLTSSATWENITPAEYMARNGVPFSIAVISSLIAANTEATHTTAAELKNLHQKYGAEIMNHTKTHAAVASVDAAIQDIYDGHVALEAIDANAMIRSFVYPGSWTGVYFPVNVADVANPVHRYVVDNYEDSQAMVFKDPQSHNGYSHFAKAIYLITAYDADKCKALVRSCASPGMRTILYCHSPGVMAADITMANLKVLVDEIIAQRNAGLLYPTSVYTCSTGQLAPFFKDATGAVIKPLIGGLRAGGFEQLATADLPATSTDGLVTGWWKEQADAGASVTIVEGTVAGGDVAEGTKAAELTLGASGHCHFTNTVGVVSGRQYLIRFAAKSIIGTASLKVTPIASYNGFNNLDALNDITVAITTDWAYYYWLVSTSRMDNKLSIRFEPAASSVVRIDDVSLQPV